MRKRAAATSRFVLPSATRRAIRRSASVSSPREGARPPMRASSARVCSAQSGAPRRSKRARASSRVVRASPRCLARRCVLPNASNVRAWWNGSVPQRACSASARSKFFDAPCIVSARGEQQRPAAGQNRQRPGPVEGSRAWLPGGEDLVRFVEFADGNQRLEQVAQVEAHARLANEHCLAQGVYSSQMLESCRRVAQRELHEPEHPAVAALGVAIRLGLRPCDCAVGSRARLADPAAVRRNNRGGQFILDLEAAELRAKLKRLGGAPRGFVPVPCPPLDVAQEPKRTRLQVGIVPCNRSTLHIQEERPRPVDVR